MAAETPMSPKRAAKKKSINGMNSPKSRRANISGGRSAASAKSTTSSGSGGRRAGLKSKKKPRSLSPPGTGTRKKKAGSNSLGGSLHASSLHVTSSSSSSPKRTKKKSVSPKVSTNKRASSAGSGVERTPSPSPASKRKVKLTKMPTPPLSAPADMSSRRSKSKIQLPYLNGSDSEDSLDLEQSFSSVRGSKRPNKGASQNDFNASMSSVASKRQNKGASQSDFNASLSSVGSTKSPKASSRKLNASSRLEVPLGSFSPSSPTRKSKAKIATNYLSPQLSPKRTMTMDSASNHSTASTRSKNNRLASMPELDSSAHKSAKNNTRSSSASAINNTRSSSASAIPKSGTGGESLAMKSTNKNKLHQVMEKHGNVGKSSSPNGGVETAPNGASLASKSLGQKNKSHNRSFFGRVNSFRPKPQNRQNSGPMKYSKTLVVIWCVVIAELTLDLVTTVISFIALVGDDTCCGFEIELGRLSLGATIPFLVLILVELGLLFYSIRLTLRASRKPEDQQAAAQKAKDAKGEGEKAENARQKSLRSVWRNLRPAGSTQDAGPWFKAINVLVLLNPFFGCVVAWILLYQTSKAEAFSVLGLEGMSILLHWTSVYLEGHEQNRWTIALHLSPLLPFLVTCTVMLIFVWKEGVCYLVEEGKFNFEGCRVCADKTLPAEIKDGITLETDKINFDDFNRQYVCGDGSEPTPGEYCSLTTNFCFYAY